MAHEVRAASIDDLDAISALTRAHRHRLAAWSPQWWRVADGADELHPLWLQHVIANAIGVARVVVADDEVIGCAFSMPQRDQWFIDDVAAIDDARWPDVADALVTGVPERPALTCMATLDTARVAAFAACEGETVSSYWIRAPLPGDLPPAASPIDVAASPPHTFHGAFDPAAPGGLTFQVDAGVVVGSASVPPPPVYGTGGTVAIVDRMYGDDLDTLVALAMAAAADRGDVLLNVVCGADDDALAAALARHDFTRTVDVVRWP